MTIPPEDMRQIKEAHKEEIMDKPNVVGVGIGFRYTGRTMTDEVTVVTLVREKIAEAGLPRAALVPREIDGVRTDVVEVGELRAQQAPPTAGVRHQAASASVISAFRRERWAWWFAIVPLASGSSSPTIM